MNDIIFAQSNTRIWFLETKMLDRATIDALTDARNFEECARMLQDSVYGGYLNTYTVETGLKMAIQDLYNEMYKIAPVKEVVDILAIRYDAHNIKYLIKNKINGTVPGNATIDAGKIPVDQIRHMIMDDNYKDMPETLSKHLKEALHKYEDTKDPQEIDMNIDKGMYQYMLEVAAQSGMKYLTTVVKLMIDITNIKLFIRIKLQDRGPGILQKAYIPGGNLGVDILTNSINNSLEDFSSRIANTDYYPWVQEGIEEYLKSGDPGSIEKYGDNYILKFLKRSKLVSFGPERLIAFILGKENEIREIRIILTGKNNEVSPDIIRGRLRDVYV